VWGPQETVQTLALRTLPQEATLGIETHAEDLERGRHRDS
jgi:hypothetical protein